MVIEDTYRTVRTPSTGLYKEKGSRFISFLLPVETAEQAKIQTDRIRKEYHDARHHCYAYRLGPAGDIWRVYDDGEPSSSAGRPIYGQILSNSLSDVLIVVVRYFGGIKLGVPGLINAYRTAAADAIANSTIITKTASKLIGIEFGYSAMNDIMKIIKDSGVSVVSQKFDIGCSIQISVRLRDEENFVKSISKTPGRILYIQ